MSAKTVPFISDSELVERDLVRALIELEKEIVRVHDMAPADALVDQHLGLALMHVRKARGSRVLPPNPYTKPGDLIAGVRQKKK